MIKYKLLIPILLFIITIPAILGLFGGDYFSMHDSQHIARLHLLDVAVSQGSLYPRWVDDLGFGYGYPLFNFYPPLIYYVAHFFVILGANYFLAHKLMLVVGFIVGTYGSYLLASRFLTITASVAVSTLYTYFGYRAISVYVRGAFAEFFAASLLPFVFLTFYNLYKKPSVKSSLYFGISLALLILAHPFIAMPAILFLGISFIFFTILLIRHLEQSEGSFRTFILSNILSTLVALGLSAFFWLPSMLERKFTLVDNILLRELASFSLHFVDPKQFWWSPWGFGGSVAGTGDGFSFTLGKIYLGLTVLAIILCSSLVAKSLTKKRTLTVYFMPYTLYLVLLLFSLFMTTSVSKPIWDSLTFLQYLQFPWRLLSFTTLFIALTGGFAIYIFEIIILNLFQHTKVSKYLPIIISAIIITVVLIIQTKYFRPQKYLDTTIEQETSFEKIAWEVSRSSFEFAPKGVRTTLSPLGTTIIDINREELSKDKYALLSGEAEVNIDTDQFDKKVFDITASEPTTFRLNTFNFPGWKAYIVQSDGNPDFTSGEDERQRLIITDKNPYKLITVNIPQGKYQLEFKFEDTPVRTVANLISLFSLGIVTVYLVGDKKKGITNK